MLDEKIKQYLTIKANMDAEKDMLETLKTDILKELGSRTEYQTSDGLVATVTLKEKFDYTDEPGMISWCESHGYSQYVVKTIDTRKMNKELKKGASLTEGLKTMYTKVESKALSVSKAED